MFETYLGTTTGVYRLSGSAIEPLGLESHRISAIHAWPDAGGVTIPAGSYENGMFRSADGGKTSQPANGGLTASCFRCISTDPLNPGAILAGTEPGRIFRTNDGGLSWQELPGITKIEGYEKWYLPYSPRAGAVRNVFAPAGNSQRLFASVEVGGLLLSDDGGETWRRDPVIDDEDIHHISGHPTEPDLLYASLGYASLTNRLRDGKPQRFGGVARSRDGGKSWQKLETDYTRATIIPPSRPDLLLAGPALDVSRDGRIVVSSNPGDSLGARRRWGRIAPRRHGRAVRRRAGRHASGRSAPGVACWYRPGPWHWRSADRRLPEVRVQAVSFVS